MTGFSEAGTEYLQKVSDQYKTIAGLTDPEVDFTFEDDGLEVTFTSSVTDPDGTSWTYAWDFGDDTTSTAANPVHTYAQAGEYEVTLVVTDDLDNESEPVTKTVEVTAGE